MEDSSESGKGEAAGAARGAQRAPARGGALRLDKRTHLDRRTQLEQGRYRIILRDYGDGIGEIGWSFIPALVVNKAGRGLSKDRDAHEDRAVRRARSRLRQLILSTRADHLLTLTYRENVIDFEQASTDLVRFVRIVKAKLPAWVYVAIAEQQKRGAWHWHIAVRGRQDVDLLRASWRHVVGDGNIDVKPPRGPAITRQLALVRYLGKYLAKGFNEGNRELNARRFRSSRGIEVPAQSLQLPREYYGSVRVFAEGQLFAATGAVGYVWTAEDKPAGWACSWR
jgi:hypothetical protein